MRVILKDWAGSISVIEKLGFENDKEYDWTEQDLKDNVFKIFQSLNVMLYQSGDTVFLYFDIKRFQQR